MIFVDTGAFLGRSLADDQHYRASVDCWDSLQKGNERCLTTSLVLSEAFTLLARRAGNEYAAAEARLIYRSRVVTILRPQEEDELAALDLMEKFADQRVSFADCVSFVLMRRHGLREAFTFDAHFRMAGFEMRP